MPPSKHTPQASENDFHVDLKSPIVYRSETKQLDRESKLAMTNLLLRPYMIHKITTQDENSLIDIIANVDAEIAWQKDLLKRLRALKTARTKTERLLIDLQQPVAKSIEVEDIEEQRKHSEKATQTNAEQPNAEVADLMKEFCHLRLKACPRSPPSRKPKNQSGIRKQSKKVSKISRKAPRVGAKHAKPGLSGPADVMVLDT